LNVEGGRLNVECGMKIVEGKIRSEEFCAWCVEQGARGRE